MDSLITPRTQYKQTSSFKQDNEILYLLILYLIATDLIANQGFNWLEHFPFGFVSMVSCNTRISEGI